MIEYIWERDGETLNLENFSKNGQSVGSWFKEFQSPRLETLYL